MTYVWPCPAKLNLFLYVTSQRPDGYHQLQTLFQFLNYGDKLTITPRKDQKIRLLTPIPGVDQEKNLIIQAACLLQKKWLQKKLPGNVHAGADINIEKKLPLGGGLGGGSSNAATVLVALNHLWRCGFTDEQLARWGLTLGADIPIFIHGQAAFAEGIGEKLQPVTPAEKWYLVAHPGISIATSAIFSASELTRKTPTRSLATLLNTPFTNDCEPIVRKQFPKVEQLLSWLLEYAPSRLTGTGACVFAEFDTESSARKVLNIAPAWLHGFVAQGVNVSPLRHALSEYTLRLSSCLRLPEGETDEAT